MYKAKVQAVSGKRVYADDKWLICIGNKPVSVGDLIFTDGRCVYGFYKESQEPPVILSKKIGPVPIIISDYYPQRHYFIFKNGSLLKIKDTNPNKYYEYDAEREIDDNPDKITLMINGYKNEIYITEDKNIIAANVDKQGNVYKMVRRIADGETKDDSGEIIDYSAIEIFKNDEKIKSIDLDKIAGYSAEGSGDDQYTYTVNWGFIENENDWAFMFGVNIEYGISYITLAGVIFYGGHHYATKKDHTGYIENMFEYSDPISELINEYHYQGKVYYVTPNEEKSIFNWNGTIYFDYPKKTTA